MTLPLISDSYLAHYGIVGQKWGTRNGPPYPLKAGDYSDSEKQAISKERKKINSKYNGQHYNDVLQSHSTKRTWSLTDEQKEKAIKYAAIAGAVAIGVALAYSANRTGLVDDYIASFDHDIVLKEGTTFQRLATESNAGFTEGVYTSYKNADKDLYKGVLGRQRITSMFNAGEDVSLQELTLTAGKDIRLPSKQVRLKEFENFFRDHPEEVSGLINKHQSIRYNRNASDYNLSYFKNKKKTNSMYLKFNDALSLSVADPDYGDTIRKFYSHMQDLGYDAIPDENDIRIGTFKAQAPIIMFNTQTCIGNIVSRDITASEIYSSYNRSIGKKLVRDFFMQGSMGFEQLKANNAKEITEYARQLQKDKTSLSNLYSLSNLAEDWSKNNFTSSQIKAVSKLLDAGVTHEDAVTQVAKQGKPIVETLLQKIGV